MEITGLSTEPIKVVIDKPEILNVISKFDKIEHLNGFLKNMGTGGNSGGNNPPPVSYAILDNNGNILYKFYITYYLFNISYK